MRGPRTPSFDSSIPISGFFGIVGGFDSCLGFGCLRDLRWSFLVLTA